MSYKLNIADGAQQAFDDALKSRASLLTNLNPTALDELITLNISDLQKRWHDLFGRHPPPRLGSDLLRRAIGYRLQEHSNGGLSRQVRLHLKSVEGKSRRSPEQKGPLKIIKPGTRFVREWQGEFHEVRAGTGGTFAYRGSDYTSLSVIARNITGTRQSGPRFFGLKQSTENKIGERGHV